MKGFAAALLHSRFVDYCNEFVIKSFAALKMSLMKPLVPRLPLAFIDLLKAIIDNRAAPKNISYPLH